MEQAGVPVVRDVVVRGEGEGTVEGASLGVQLLPDLGVERRFKLRPLVPGAETDIDTPDVRLEPGRLRRVLEREKAVLRVRVYSGEECLAEEIRDVSVLAFNEWPGAQAPLGLLATFVTPNQAALVPVVQAAKQLLLMQTASDAIDGYQSRSRARALAFVRAGFDAVRGLELSYTPAPASFERIGQKVRLVDDVLAQRFANCLDATLFFASLFEAMGLHPLPILVEGHSLLAVWLTEDRFPEGLVEDPARLRTLMELGSVVAFETTAALGGGKGHSFEEANALARQVLVKDDEFVAALDVRVLRYEHFKPLSLRALDQPGADGFGQAVPVDVDAARHALRKATEESRSSMPPAADGPGRTSPTKRRFERWKERLLDLTLRNKLLNFRTAQRGALALEVPDVAGFEDLLAQGKAFELMPRPDGAGAAASARDAGLVAARAVPAEVRERRLRDLAAGVLHSQHTPDDLWSRATFLDRTARTNFEEGGASTLYVAVGFLRWFETPESTDVRVAPLLLYPVTLGFDRLKRRVRFQRLDEDPVANQTLIEKLRVDYRVDLSPLATLEADDSGVDVNRSLRVAREAVQQMPRWEILEEAHLGLFSFTKFLMWKDLADNAEALLANPVVQHIADHQAGPGVAKAPDLAPETLDERDAAALPCVVDADSTQMLAIEAALGGGGLVLQGPPGTGKSQTITNLVAAALARNETVLFVSEKMAALEVVYRRLRDVGLEDFCLELHSHKTTRKQVVDSFASVFRPSTAALESGAWEQASAELVTERRRLNDYARLIHARTPLGQTLYDVFGRLRQLDGAPSLALPFPDPLGLTPARLAEQRAAVESFSRRAGGVAPVASNPWRWALRTEWSEQLQQQLQDALSAVSVTLPALDQASAALAASLGTAAPRSTDDVARLLDSGGTVQQELDVLCRELEAGPVPRPALEASNWQQLADEASTFSEESRALQTLQQGLAARWTDAFRALDLAGMRAQLERAAKAFFLWAWVLLWIARRRLRPVAQKGLPPDGQILADIEAVQQEPARKESLRSLRQRVEVSLSDVWAVTGGAPDALDDAIGRGRRARAARERLETLEYGPRVLATGPATWRRTQAQLAAQRTTLEPLLARLLEAEANIRTFAGASSVPWPAPSAPEHRAEFGAWVATLMEALYGFRAWCLYQKDAAALRNLGLTPIAEAHAAGQLGSEQLLGAWEKGVLSRWFRASVDREPLLREFEGAAHDNLVERFAHLDREHVMRARLWIATQLRRRVPSLDSAPRGSELFVLRREMEKKARHLPVRKLLAEISSVRPRLKPCLLMSPLSVAQYLPPSIDFDVVVFDEASQIETHDAIGAIARGRKVVIVGDSKQLPPTRFFSRANEDQEAPVDENDVTELDSVLDEAKAKNLPERTLGWHYRSRHDALIEFSNAHYYDNRLQVFPAARRNVADLGISWHPVPEGVFNSGGTRAESRTNPVEARALVAHLIQSLKEHAPGSRTFGVVTFSLTQKELIESLLDRARVEHPAIEGHFAGSEGVFVKNLENVQGDERDEILFSIAYARNEKGVLRHHFGPLSNSGGERRLNVAVTRARRQLRVFSTLTHDQIDTGRTHAIGTAHLRAFLKFAAERGRSSAGESGAPRFRSAFEQEIHDVLTQTGYRVDTQVGCGSYVLDLAVQHPRKPGVYALGIETDGPMYHLAKTARDRDRLRRQVLSDLGWRVHRVWAMEWHHRRVQEAERLLAAAHEACTADAPPSKRTPTELPVRATAQRGGATPAPPASRTPPSRSIAAGSPYLRARLDSITSDSAELYQNLASVHLRTTLKKLIDVEAPIHRSAAAKRVIECWGMMKLTQKAESRVREVADDLIRSGAIALLEDYYWRQDIDAAAYRDFRTTGGEAREAHQIAPEEVANAIGHVLGQVGSMNIDGLVREAARLFGIERVGSRVQDAMRAGLTCLEQTGRCRIEGDRVRPIDAKAPPASGTRTPVAFTARPPTTAPASRYRIERRLGEGGMAECYLATDTQAGTQVFLKRVAVGSTHASALQREIDIYAKLQYATCEHVVSVIDYERDEHFVSLIIELADGGDLRSHVEKHPAKRLSLTDALGVALQVARGIAELHDLSIVHRDLKPENVLMSGGRWKLADFGIAKSQRNAAPGVTFQQAGTYGYAAPEQFEGTQAEPSADVYSFGKLLVFLLTGTTDLDRLPLEYAEARQLARRCATPVADARPTIGEVIRSIEELMVAAA